MFEIIFLASFISISILIISALIKILRKEPKIDKDEYIISMKILSEVMDNYRDLILLPEIDKIKGNYDLNPESKMNSSHLFYEEKNKLINKSIQIVLKQISPQVLKSLLRYYSKEGLLHFIISNFRSI